VNNPITRRQAGPPCLLSDTRHNRTRNFAAPCPWRPSQNNCPTARSSRFVTNSATVGETANCPPGHRPLQCPPSPQRGSLHRRDACRPGRPRRTGREGSDRLGLVPGTIAPASDGLSRADRSHVNPHPFDRVEPRKIKRDRHRHPYLQEPRNVAREKRLTWGHWVASPVLQFSQVASPVLGSVVSAVFLLVTKTGTSPSSARQIG